MSIRVRVKRIYGNDYVYPDCQSAKLFAKLIGRKTLNVGDIQIIKDLGFEVNVLQEKVTL